VQPLGLLFMQRGQVGLHKMHNQVQDLAQLAAGDPSV
jgi:hypothetical protein